MTQKINNKLKEFTPKENQQFKTGILILNCLLAIVALILGQYWSRGADVSVTRLDILGVLCTLNILVTVIILVRLKRWSKEFWIFLVFFISIVGPITTFTVEYILKRPTDKDFIFNPKTRSYLSFYKPNDIWIFEDSKSRIDTFQITKMDSNMFVPPLIHFMSPGPFKWIEVHYRQRPIDSWHSTTLVDTGRIYEDARLIDINKSNGEEEVSLDFKNFYVFNRSDSIGVLKTDILEVSGIKFKNYYNISLDKDEKWQKDSDYVTDVYWVNKYGIIAYKYKNGDLWKRINLH